MNPGMSDDSVKDYYRLLSASKTEKNVKQKMRYDAVLLFMEGYPRKQISQILHIPLRTVSDHISHYKKGGIEALDKAAGRPQEALRCTGGRTPVCDFHEDSTGSRRGCFCQLDCRSCLRLCGTAVRSIFQHPGNAQSFSTAGASLYQADLYIE